MGELLGQWPPWWPPLFLLGAFVALVLSAPTAALLGVRIWVSFGLLASLAFVVVVTLTADRSVALSDCLWGYEAPVVPWEISLDSSRWLNTALFIPLGFFAGLVSVRRWWIVLIALVISPLVEWIQLKWEAIHRTCQIQDIVDNTWGVVIGLLAGVLAGLVLRRWVAAPVPDGRV